MMAADLGDDIGNREDIGDPGTGPSSLRGSAVTAWVLRRPGHRAQAGGSALEDRHTSERQGS
ncbi:MAG TPA: hypothetical protein VEK07_05290 [Polyangiaceae bacterium]|nr:hypothetical protein [Polyangiaceae bacterium]